MVRRCVVPTCNSNDNNTLSHRFPRNLLAAGKWQQNLSLFNYDLHVLITKYVVCTKHFNSTAYRNSQSKFLNSTAVPNLDTSSNSNLSSLNLSESHQLESNNLLSNLNRIANQSSNEPIVKITNIDNETRLSSNSHFQSLQNSEHEFSNQCDIQPQDVEYIDDTETSLNELGTGFCEYIPQPTDSTLSTSTFADILLDANEELYCCDDVKVAQVTHENAIEQMTMQEIECLEDSESNISHDSIVANGDFIEDSLPAVATSPDIDESPDEYLSPDQYYQMTTYDSEKDAYKNMSKECLIEQLIMAKKKIADLEAKLETIELAHNTMIGSLEAFKNVLKS